jgi:lipopolysaccharide/colanic/teichoic acid biosynthesis glycosyltransferase
MSLLGPRPCTPYELESYLPWHHARFDTLPGLTGRWQVSGKNNTTFTETINLDIRYARNQSLWLDAAS